jgi:hypothetical protein
MTADANELVAEIHDRMPLILAGRLRAMAGGGAGPTRVDWRDWTCLPLAIIAALSFHFVGHLPASIAPWLAANLKNGLIINVVLAVFNLFLLPPLDGGRYLVGVLPRRNLYAQVRAVLIFVFPSRNVAANFIATNLIELPRNFRQCVVLKQKLTSRIRRFVALVSLTPMRPGEDPFEKACFAAFVISSFAINAMGIARSASTRTRETAA